MSLQPICDNQRHLIVKPYNIPNLHAMAEQLGIQRHWFHSSPYPHYDIPQRRRQEIESKTTMVSPKQLLKIIKESLDA